MEMVKPARGNDDRAAHPPPGAGISGGHGHLMALRLKRPLLRMRKSEPGLISYLKAGPGAPLGGVRGPVLLSKDLAPRSSP